MARRQLASIGAGPATQLEHDRSFAQPGQDLTEIPTPDIGWAVSVPGREIWTHMVVAIRHDAFWVLHVSKRSGVSFPRDLRRRSVTAVTRPCAQTGAPPAPPSSPTLQPDLHHRQPEDEHRQTDEHEEDAQHQHEAR